MHENRNEYDEVKKLLILSILAGKIMLKSGAETYRVEDTINRICKSRKNINYVESLVTATGISVSVEYDEEIITYIKRIKSISIDLNKIDMVNNFSREFVNGNISIEEGLKRLERINNTHIYNNLTKLVFGSLAGSFYTIMFGGNFMDFVSSLMVSLIVVFVTNYLAKREITFFINNFVGAFLASILSILLVKLHIGKNMDMIIIGSIMPLVPGVAITNSIRDTMSGDFISGSSRGIEAAIIAFSIAFGVGLVLKLYFKGAIM